MSADAKAEVVTFGEVLVAFVAADPGPLAEAHVFSRHIVGAESNTAVGLVRLGHPCSLIARVGSDALGRAALRRLRGEGVDVRHVRSDATAPTGVLVRDRRTVGPSEVVYGRRGSAGSTLDPADIHAAAHIIASARWMHVTGITPGLSSTAREATLEAIRLAAAGGLTTSLDVNYRGHLWSAAEARPVLLDLVGAADVVLASPTEARLILDRVDDDAPESLADGLLRLGPETAVIRLGAAGALVRTRDGATARDGGHRVEVADPIGAGDAFSAGFIAALLDGADIATALEVGNICGSSAVSAIGDIEGLPTPEAVERLRRSGEIDTIR